MYIDQNKCTKCSKCIPTCPVGAIYVNVKEKQVLIDQDLCVECGVCYRSDACEFSALVAPELTWPRTIRAALSNPLIVNPETRIPGRGTEEMKTNDVTGRFKIGYLGVAAELGRPGVGASLVDIQKVSRACARVGVHFCPQNPITHLMINKETGDINPEVMNERVLSGIVEMDVELDLAEDLLLALKDVAKDLDTVFSLDIISLVGPEDTDEMARILDRVSIIGSPNGKTNMGLGKPSYTFFEREH